MHARHRLASVIVTLLTASAMSGAVPAQEATTTEQEQEQRLLEYLVKKETARARRELGTPEPEAAAVKTAAVKTAAVKTAAAKTATAKSAVTRADPPQETAPARRRRLPRGLAAAQANVRSSNVGADPTVVEYLDLIDEAAASPDQLAAFANFVAENGLMRDALEYYRIAIRLKKDDALLWVNIGTLHRQLGDVGSAASAYRKAIGLDPNQALAYYNLAAIHDEQGHYDKAVLAYKTALQLDPGLADTALNPQAAGNELLTAVRMMLYRDQLGSLGLPLVDVTRQDESEPE